MKNNKNKRHDNNDNVVLMTWECEYEAEKRDGTATRLSGGVV